jgi:DNA-binding PadR family transcriptional regulator
MPKTNYAKYMIMGLLSCAPMTGYDIKKWADECLKYLLMDMSYGQIYPILNRLEQDGLATVVLGTTGKRPGSKTYRLTEKGQGEIRAWVRSPDTKEYDILLKMCFGSLIPKEEIIRKLEAYRKKREGELAIMGQHMSEAGDETIFGANAPYMLLITMLGLDYFKEEVSWCDQAIAMLEDRIVT